MEYFRINNRRYLGNKYKLLEWIRQVVDENCEDVGSVFDVFSGTGSVSSAFLDKLLVVNDMMYSNYLAALCWFSPEAVDRERLAELIDFYNGYDASQEVNYMSENFADTYFNGYACRKIGFIREHIEALYRNDGINARERASLVTSLLYAMDRISHTCGHYDAYIRDGKYTGELVMRMPENDYEVNEGNQIFCMDSNGLAPEVAVDLAYLDPPYNSRQYCDAYHLLENVARWERPEVFGVARKMDRRDMKSRYCKDSSAKEAFRDIVMNLRCRYIMLSYNDSGKKLKARSNAKLSDEDIMEILAERGEVEVFAKRYKGFDAGKSDVNKDNRERLFLCTVRQ